MEENGNIQIDGLVEQRKDLEVLLMSNPDMEKAQVSAKPAHEVAGSVETEAGFPLVTSSRTAVTPPCRRQRATYRNSLTNLLNKN